MTGKDGELLEQPRPARPMQVLLLDYVDLEQSIVMLPIDASSCLAYNHTSSEALGEDRISP